MSNEINNNEVAEVVESKTEKKVKDTPKKENIFKRIWKKFVKLCKDTVGEMKKVVWTPKAELVKNTKLVILAVVIVAVAILAIDTGFSYLINTIAGLIG
jgi:preprotein translocase SecE subunit